MVVYKVYTTHTYIIWSLYVISSVCEKATSCTSIGSRHSVCCQLRTSHGPYHSTKTRGTQLLSPREQQRQYVSFIHLGNSVLFPSTPTILLITHLSIQIWDSSMSGWACLRLLKWQVEDLHTRYLKSEIEYSRYNYSLILFLCRNFIYVYIFLSDRSTITRSITRSPQPSRNCSNHTRMFSNLSLNETERATLTQIMTLGKQCLRREIGLRSHMAVASVPLWHCHLALHRHTRGNTMYQKLLLKFHQVRTSMI